MESQKYKFLSGANSRGFDYEKKIAALISLNCLLPYNDIDDFWIGTNIADKIVGKFDDVILCIQKHKCPKKRLYLLQLKHYEDQRRLKKLNYSSFATKKDFMLDKYADSIVLSKKLSKDADYIFKDAAPSDITYILYTNQCSGLEEIHESKLKDDVLFRTGGSLYKFREYGDVSRAFLDRLYILTDQENEELLEKIIFERLKTLSSSVSMETCKKYVTFMESWASGVLGGFRTVTKTEVQAILAELLVTPLCCVRNVPVIDSATSDNVETGYEIWKWLLDNHQVITVQQNVLSQEEMCFVARIIHERLKTIHRSSNWTKLLTKDELQLVYENLSEYDIVSTYGPDNITLENVYFTLWRLHGLPLLVKLDGNSCKNFTAAIALANKTKYVALVDEEAPFSLELTAEVKYFSSLMDLKLDFGHSSRRNFELLSRQELRLQGRAIELGCLLDADKDDSIKREIKTHHLVQLFCRNLNVGCVKTKLPRAFIERRVEPVWISREVLTELTNCFLVILEVNDGDFDSFLGDSYLKSDFLHVFQLLKGNVDNVPGDCRILLCSAEDNDLDYKSFLMPEKSGRDLHILQLHAINGRFHFEWIETYGNISEIRSFRLNEAINLPVKPNLLSYIDRSRMHVIASSSGMGKTIFLDYLAQICPTNFWILRVNLNEHCQYISSFTAGDPIQNLLYFSNKSSDGRGAPLEEAIFANYLANKKLWLLFDAFDEIVPLCTEKALELIKSVSSYGCRIFITTRSTAQTFLEDHFNLMAKNISPFTMTDQKNYLTKYFRLKIPSIGADTLHNFVDNLLNTTNQNFLRFNSEFLGIPLQMKMLARIFYDKCASLVDGIEDNLLNLDLIDLVEEFITLKVDLYWKDKLQNKDNALNQLAYEDYKKRSMSNHMLCAVNTFFAKHLDGIVFDDVKDFIISVREGKEKTGLIERIDENGNIKFMHQSILEYFVALWMSQNASNRDLLLRLFEPEHTTIRAMFDRILARNCPLHLAVLSNNEKAVCQLLQKGEYISCKDAGGRTALHLAAAWGLRHVNEAETDVEFCRKYGDSTIKEEILNLLLSKCQELEETDEVFEFTPIDYAISSFSLKNVDILLGNNASIVGFNSLIKLVQPKKLMILCAANDLKNVAQNFMAHLPNVDVGSIKLRGVKDSLLHVAAKTGSIKVIQVLSKCIKVDVVNVLQQTALHLAAQYGHSDIIKLLVASGASVNQIDESSCTPIQVAERYGNPEAFEVLLSAGSRVDDDFKRFLASSGELVSGKWMAFVNRALPLVENRELEDRIKAEVRRTGDMIAKGVEPVVDKVKEIFSPETEQSVKEELRRTQDRVKEELKRSENNLKEVILPRTEERVKEELKRAEDEAKRSVKKVQKFFKKW